MRLDQAVEHRFAPLPVGGGRFNGRLWRAVSLVPSVRERLARGGPRGREKGRKPCRRSTFEAT